MCKKRCSNNGLANYTGIHLQPYSGQRVALRYCNAAEGRHQIEHRNTQEHKDLPRRTALFLLDRCMAILCKHVSDAVGMSPICSCSHHSQSSERRTHLWPMIRGEVRNSWDALTSCVHETTIRNAKNDIASIDSNISASQLRRRSSCSVRCSKGFCRIVYISMQRVRVGCLQLHRDVRSAHCLCRVTLQWLALKPLVPTAKSRTPSCPIPRLKRLRYENVLRADETCVSRGLRLL